MADIIMKDYWCIETKLGYIKVTEQTKNFVLAVISEPTDTMPWIDVEDMFGSACHLRTASILQVFHINEEILKKAAAHSKWARSFE